MLGLDYSNRFNTNKTDEALDRRQRMEQLRLSTEYWFKDNWLMHRMVGKYEYFGTFNFDPDWVLDKDFDDISNSIKHFQGVLRKKLFGRGDFELNFFPVIETVKWVKEFKRYVPVRKHAHILFGDPPEHVRLNKDFETLLVDSWMTLKESGDRSEQLVKAIYGTHLEGESYITKLRHSNVDWFDKKNFTEIKNQHLLDEDFSDWIERNSLDIYDSTFSKN